MSDLTFAQMQAMQRSLQEKYIEKWGGLSEKEGRNQLLWMMIEAGEMADIIKKQGDEAILHDAQARAHFVEETCDVLMYLNDVMLCYGITPEELAAAYRKKHEHNMKRW